MNQLSTVQRILNLRVLIELPEGVLYALSGGFLGAGVLHTLHLLLYTLYFGY